MSSQEISVHDLLLLAFVPGVGSQRLRSLVSYFGTPAAVLHAAPAELIRVEGIDRKLASTIVHSPRCTERVEEQLSRLNKVNGSIITLWDPSYPELLKRIYDPPAFLFVRGTLIPSDKYSLAVVGTRRPSSYGKFVAQKFSTELAEKGLTIVSGLARGVDTIAHHASLHAGGRTIAIIGSAVDVMYPPENTKLAESIESSGAVISEFFMGTEPDPGNFPRRNRLISGMTLGTLIIESADDGGAMITASTALDQNRELFSIPANITERSSAGTNALIRDGYAKLVQSVDDILMELGSSLNPVMTTKCVKPAPQLSVFEQKIYDVLSSQTKHIDSIADETGFSTADTLVNLLNLEFKGLVRQLAGKMFIRTD